MSLMQTDIISDRQPTEKGKDDVFAALPAAAALPFFAAKYVKKTKVFVRLREQQRYSDTAALLSSSLPFRHSTRRGRPRRCSA